MNGRMIAIGALAVGIGLLLFFIGAFLLNTDPESTLYLGSITTGTAMFYTGIALSIVGIIVVVLGFRD